MKQYCNSSTSRVTSTLLLICVWVSDFLKFENGTIIDLLREIRKQMCTYSANGNSVHKVFSRFLREYWSLQHGVFRRMFFISVSTCVKLCEVTMRSYQSVSTKLSAQSFHSYCNLHPLYIHIFSLRLHEI